MKKILLMFAMLMPALSGLAQSEAGKLFFYSRIGTSVSNLSKMERVYIIGDKQDSIDSKYKAGLTVGGELEYRATDEMSLSAGVFYQQLGCRYPEYTEDLHDGQGNVQKWGMDKNRVKLQYLSVPLMLNGYVAHGLCLKAGVQVSCLLSSKWTYDLVEVTEEVGDGGVPKYTYGSRTAGEVKPATNRVDLSIPVGISYEYMNVVLDARYNYGLLKTFKKTFDDYAHNRYFTFTVGYKFEL